MNLIQNEVDTLFDVVQGAIPSSSKQNPVLDLKLDLLSTELTEQEVESIQVGLRAKLSAAGLGSVAVTLGRESTEDQAPSLLVSIRPEGEWFVVTRELSDSIVFTVTTLEENRPLTPGVEFLVPTLKDGAALAAALNGDGKYDWITFVDDLNANELIKIGERLQQAHKEWSRAGIVVKSWAPLGHGGFTGASFI